VVAVPDVRFWADQGGMLLRRARHAASMRQKELAVVSGTSRTTLSAYEHGRKSPTLETAGRILDAAGFRLTLEPKECFTREVAADGRAFFVPAHLRRLPAGQALGMAWRGDRVYDLADREQRRAAYAWLLCEGGPQDLLEHVDGVLLVELWEDLDLPPAIRAAWAPVIAKID